MSRPSLADCRSVSSNRMTPEINSSIPNAVNSVSRNSRRSRSSFGIPICDRRLPIVGGDSSAAKIPLPGTASA